MKDLCPFCDDGLSEPITPIVLKVGTVSGTAYICKMCKIRALDSYKYAGSILKQVIDDMVDQRRQLDEEDDSLPF
jgi:hypothetical protein